MEQSLFLYYTSLHTDSCEPALPTLNIWSCSQSMAWAPHPPHCPIPSLLWWVLKVLSDALCLNVTSLDSHSISFAPKKALLQPVGHPQIAPLCTWGESVTNRAFQYPLWMLDAIYWLRERSMLTFPPGSNGMCFVSTTKNHPSFICSFIFFRGDIEIFLLPGYCFCWGPDADWHC